MNFYLLQINFWFSVKAEFHWSANSHGMILAKELLVDMKDLKNTDNIRLNKNHGDI